MRESQMDAARSAWRLFREWFTELLDDIDNMLHLEPDDEHEDA